MSKGIAFGVSGSFVPVDSGTSWLADVAASDYSWTALTLSALADAAGRQSAKADLGLVRPREWDLFGCVDYTGETTMTSGETVDYYWAASFSGTAGNSNLFANSGSDAACPDGAIGSLTLAEFLDGCQFIGSLVISNDAAVQSQQVNKNGPWIPNSRFGQLIVVNNGGDSFEADDVEAHQVAIPRG